jgi:hypothetical protein
MSKGGWPRFSFTELLKPPEGWRTDQAILSSYSADLVVILTSLLALSGCELEGRRTGSRVELVRAIEALRDRVRILAQAGRVPIPGQKPILKLMDKFLTTVVMDEAESSFHAKAALLRFHNLQNPEERQWRIWLGSRNLTRALNWEAGLVLVSRADGKGQIVDGLPLLGEVMAARAKLSGLPPRSVQIELGKLTWECPAGCEVKSVRLLGPGTGQGFPRPPDDIERMFVVSPFLDATTVRAAGAWGGPKTRRTLVSTDPEFQRLHGEDGKLFLGFEHLCRQPLPELPAESAVMAEEENHAVVEMAEGEEIPAQGLHAKLLYAAKGKRRQLWVGSANATARGWDGRNVEIVAEMTVNQEIADGIEGFVETCERYTPVATATEVDPVEEALEAARKALSGRWTLRQIIRDGVMEIIASTAPPVPNPDVKMEIAPMGGAWKCWPRAADRIEIGSVREWERTNFVQIRVKLGEMACAWLQVAVCDPAPDDKRDHGVIAQYLDPNTFLLWLRSLLTDHPVEDAGGDWDSETNARNDGSGGGAPTTNYYAMPTVEEILRAWARDAAAFRNADQKVKTYLSELERRASENNTPSDLDLLCRFRKTWDALAGELQ